MFSVCAGFLLVCSALSEARSTICSENQFPCDDGTCIRRESWCDSTEDCPDDSDEIYCMKRFNNIENPNKCKVNYFLCKDGPCIPIAGHCDNYTSCEDKSDEEDCGTTVHVTEYISENETWGATKAMQTLHEDSLQLTTQHVLLNDSNNHDFPLNVQLDQVSKKVTVKDLSNDFKEVDVKYYSHEKNMAETWILDTRDNEYGWGDETARAITALYLSDHLPKNDILITKQLHLKLFEMLIRNQTEVLPLSELASYINALHATCDNPRNFHGHDLVNILRERTNVARKYKNYVSPLVYLTLCISNSTTHTDINQIKELFSGNHSVSKIDIQALATLAGVCISNLPQFSTQVGHNLAKRLFEKVDKLGLPGNIYELGLVAQALNEAKINQNLWKRSEALNWMRNMQQSNGSFGDILATYYALPVFSGKSIATLAKHCYPKTNEHGMTSRVKLLNMKEEKMFITYSLYFGDPMEVSQTLRIRVGKSSFLDVMTIAEATNPIYRFKCDMTSDKPLVYSIGGIANDAEQGLYWILHIQKNNSVGLVPYDDDIRSYIPDVNDHAVFWRKYFY